MIEIRNLVKYHGTQRVLDGANASFTSGKLTALVGPSGGGKSTLLRCINGLETFHEGEIRIGDDLKLVGTGGRPHDTRTLLAIRKRVGMVFQQFNLFPHLTVLDNVMLAPVRAAHVTRAAARATALALLEKVGIPEKAAEHPARLSGGQQQRVAIARALAMGPKIMLFDEPTSALDAEMIREVLDVMRDLAKEGMTMLVVSHELGFAREAANRVLFMDGGRIVEDSPADEFFTAPKEERAKQFLSKVIRH